MMRIVVWNINGLRTLRGYQPWYQLSDWQKCLEYLNADIACFQETKMTRKQLQEWMGILPDYHAFFNFHPTKGYSGTVTYVKKHACIPLKAEQGITGRLADADDDKHAIGSYPRDVRDHLDTALWNALDAEGRAVLIDCGVFVLFNLYCPNETGPERLEYKMSYYHALQERADRLIQAGRQVMIVGDMNVIREPIDHCDPQQSIRESGWTHFKQHPAREWFDTFLAPRGKFHDVGRLYHPTRAKMYTNWNTLIDARPANYGVRLDYTLVTEGLLPWIKGADIQPEIYGSDHCPIYLDLHDQREIEGQTVLLKDLMDSGSSRPPPPLAACFYDEFSGKQRKLASFFSAKKVVAPTPSPAPIGEEEQEREARETLAFVGGEDELHKEGQVEPSLADALFALQSSASGEAPSPAVIEDGTNGKSEDTMQASNPPRRVTPSPRPSSRSIIQSPAAASSSSPPKRSQAVASRAPSSAASAAKKAPSKAAKDGQMRLQSFFSKPAAPPAPVSTPSAAAEASSSSSSAMPAAAMALVVNGSQAQSTQDTSKALDHRDERRSSSTDSFEPFDETTDSLPDPKSSQHTRTVSSASSASHSSLLDSSSAVSNTGPSAANRVVSSLAWGAIFSPIPPPTCRNHSEPAKAWTVNKPGPNHNRKFWLCSQPIGPGYEKSGRAKGDMNPEYRCNFFLWDSEWRGEVAKSRKKDEREEKDAQSFAEVGRRKGAKGRGETVMGGDNGAPHKKVRTTK